MRPPKPVHRRTHGTPSSYNRCLKDNDGQACSRCKEAHRVYTAAKRARRRDQRRVLNSMLSGGQNTSKITWAEYDRIMKTIKEDLGL